METEKKVSRGLHGVSIGSIVAVAALALMNPKQTESFFWYLNNQENVEPAVEAIPELQSLVFDIRIKMQRLEATQKHKEDSLINLIQALQRGLNVVATGKQPYDSVLVNNRLFHIHTPWLWRKRD